MRSDKHNEKGNEPVASMSFKNKVIMVLLCLCVVGGVTIFNLNKATSSLKNSENSDVMDIGSSIEIEGLGKEMSEAVAGSFPITDSKGTADEVGEIDPNESSDVNHQNEGNGSSVEQGNTSETWQMPVEGSMTKKFTMNELVYNSTLNQYEAHKGIDIEASLDTSVKAAQAGTVVKVFKDGKYGQSVWISHGNGIVSKYCGLTPNVKVSEADVVEKGTELGAVGETNVFERADPPHLHFQVEKDGEAIDPMTLLQ